MDKAHDALNDSVFMHSITVAMNVHQLTPQRGARAFLSAVLKPLSSSACYELHLLAVFLVVVLPQATESMYPHLYLQKMQYSVIPVLTDPDPKF